MNELDEMKEQLRSLKQQLDKQTMLNEERLRKTLRHKSNKLARRANSAFLGVIFAVVLVCAYFYYFRDFPLSLNIFTVAFILLAAGWDAVVMYRLHLRHIFDKDLLEAQTNLQKYMRLNRIWITRIGIPFLCIWVPWFLYEVSPSVDALGVGEQLAVLCVCLGLVGGVIGFVIGYFGFYRPQMRLAEQMLADIHDLQEMGG